MCDAFFSPKFSECARCLSPKNYNLHAIFHQFSDVKNAGQSQKPSILSQLVASEPQHTGISCPKES